jgi:hypothetical protein
MADITILIQDKNALLHYCCKLYKPLIEKKI